VYSKELSPLAIAFTVSQLLINPNLIAALGFELAKQEFKANSKLQN
jgi:hypothetical protein